MSKDFYIGYLPKMPTGLKRYVKPFVVLCFGIGGFLSLLFWLGQKPFANSVFEFTQVKEFEGTIQAKPIPFLLIEDMASETGLPVFKRYALVAEGKHGVGDEVANLDGHQVKLKGTLIYRDNLQMIEVASEPIADLANSGTQTAEKSASLGTQTLRGEIIDSKCYLGVMNPGSTKPHRECAVRCLSGGVPPIFVVKDASGNTSELWLTSATSAPVNKDILDFVAEPVEIAGEVTRTGDQLFFSINPKNIKRLP